MIHVVNVKDHSPTENDFYIGRGSPLGNPYIFSNSSFGEQNCEDRKTSLELYSSWIRTQISCKNKIVCNELFEIYKRARLADVYLVCHCKPLSCHGDIVKNIIEEKLYTPDSDGINHINIYSKGATELGRLLTNFAHTPFVHQDYGKFESVEGFWYWVKTEKQYDEFHHLWGIKAKKRGQELFDKAKDKKEIPEEFKIDIISAIECKINQNKNILKLLKESSLPLTHYYAFGSTGKWKVVPLPQYNWIVKSIDFLRNK